MDVILMERVDKLGNMGEVVKVKPGFARNYLLPQKKALRATKDNREYFESQRSELEATNAAQHIAALMEADWTDPSNPVYTGNTAHGNAAVLSEFTQYYRALFADKTTNNTHATRTCLDTLSDPKSRRVLPPTAAACGAPIEEDELRKTLEKLPTGKSPGPDRIPNKFYRVLSATIAPILTKTLNEGAAAGALHPTATEGIGNLSPVQKEGP